MSTMTIIDADGREIADLTVLDGTQCVLALRVTLTMDEKITLKRTWQELFPRSRVAVMDGSVKVYQTVKAYVLETGTHEDRTVRGVFSSLKKARAAWHPMRPTALDYDRPWHSYVWGGRDRPVNEFDADGEDYATVHEVVLDELMPEGVYA